MKILTIHSTPTTPSVHFDPLSGELSFNGRLIPEDPAQFYSLITEWIATYIENPAENTTIEINCEYINTGALKGLLSFLKQVEKIHGKQSKVSVIWRAAQENIQLIEIGEDIRSVVHLPFDFRNPMNND